MSSNQKNTPALGISGRIAAFFQFSQLTPLLALLAMLLGIFAVMVTPREEEPQINVTMANVLIPFPGASVSDVEQTVATPAEQVLSQIADVEHVMSVSRPGLAIITVQFKVGVPRTEALVRLYDTVNSNADWLPQGMGVMPPIIKPKGIDDVPIVALTLFSKDNATTPYDLERVAHSLEVELKRVPGTREVTSIGGPGRAVLIEVDAAKLANSNLTIGEIQQTLQSANAGLALGDTLSANKSISIEAGEYFQNADDIANLVLAVRNGKPLYLQDVATVKDGPLPTTKYVWHGEAGDKAQQYPALTISITKKPGQNAIDVAASVMDKVESLKNTIIPANFEVIETRNYGASANEKAVKLIQKLLFATAFVVALVFFALGKREAAIVGTAVVLTLTVTLFASWAWGFTLNRVSLFALIFSIGILVDDAIVVVENIHRHQQLYPGKSLASIIPAAVDEVGGPTILATFTVIAALLPMAFVSGLMGPYMSPIPINASMGMVLSLAIAFVVTPWLARIWMKEHAADKDGHAHQEPQSWLIRKLNTIFEKLFTPLLDTKNGAKNRRLLGLGVAGLIALSLVLPATGLVLLKMLPFDNKAEFQVIVDMPAGTPLEQTQAALTEMGRFLATEKTVTHYQTYAGTAAPINFNGLVRQYFLRSGAEVGDIQVNLVDKHDRSEKSHEIATRLRPQLQAIAKQFGANAKIVEVPPGPPVLAPIVAEIYGPDAKGRQEVAKAVKAMYAKTSGVVDIDESATSPAPKKLLIVDKRKAAIAGVSQQHIVQTLYAGLSGTDATYLHNESKYAVAAHIRLPDSERGDLDTLLSLRVKNNMGQSIPIRELVTISDTEREQTIYHKDLLPVNFVVADMAGKVDSPLYAMFGMRSDLAKIVSPNGGTVQEYFVQQPNDTLRDYAVKWDGEWQITYETFRDMGLAYGVGLILIYLLVVAQFGSYLTPLIIMAPIPLTIIGVMPGHALFGAQFTATSMIGMIALAGIIVRNSILLVDFINLQVRTGMALEDAVKSAAIARAQPILLTGLAAMLGALFILDDPIFNGLALSLIFGILVSTLLTLVVIPILYFSAYKNRLDAILSPAGANE